MNGRVLRILYQPYKWLVYLPLFVISTVAFILLGMPIIALFGPDAANRIAGRGWARFNGFVTPMRVTLVGRENIRKGQSYVVVANHQSSYDIFVLWGYLVIDARWVIKKELRRVPLFGYALYASRNVFIDRRDRGQAVKGISEGVRRLPKGVSVLFFAEGTRSADGSIGQFKKGGFYVALEMGLPILPVTVNGSRRVLPKKSLVFTPGPIEVVVGDPIETGGYTRENIQELVDRARDVITAGFDPDYPRSRL